MAKKNIVDTSFVIFTITNKIKERKVFLKLYDDSYDAKLEKHKIKEPKEIDNLGREIKQLLDKNVDTLPVDFIIESLTHLGDAPNVMYDDNGMFAVSGDGYQPVVFGNQRIEGGLTVVVEKKMWKSTIRKALKYYMQN
jgi:hypothetical protein